MSETSAPRRAEDACLRAFAALQVADFPRALGAARRVESLSPGDPYGHALASLALRGLGRFQEAEAQAREALARLPDHPDLRFTLGLCLWSSGEPRLAREQFEAALARRPDRQDMLLDMAGFLLHQRQFDEALAIARKAAGLDAGHPKLTLLLACAEQGMWRAEVDALAFRPPLPLPEDQPGTYLRLGRSQLEGGFIELALDEFSRALDLDPDLEEAQRLFATAFLMRKHGYFAWARTWRVRLRRPGLLLAWLSPIPTLGASAWWLAGQRMNLPAVGAAIAAALYGLFLLWSFSVGGQLLTRDHFRQLIASRNLTPQGRRKQTGQVLDELDEVRGAHRGRRSLETGTGTAPPTHEAEPASDPTLLRRQLEGSSRLLWQISNSLSGFAVVGGLTLMWSVIRKNTPGLLLTPEVALAERVSALITVGCVLGALFFRGKAREVASRFPT